MLHPILDLSRVNVVLSLLGIYILIFGFIAVKIKQRWYLGEAFGTVIGPFGAKLINVSQWGGGDSDSGDIVYGLTRLVIGIAMVKVGYELPKRYLRLHLVELTICLLPLMTIQWLTTSACIKLMIPGLSFLTALIIGSCVICIDPVLSQAVAKGPFADQYVRRHLREFISAEAGGNDGFGFPFLLLSIALLRYADAPGMETVKAGTGEDSRDWIGEPDTGRLGGDVGRALAHWAVEGVLYMLVMGAGYGVLVGFLSRKALKLASKRHWVDKEGFFSYPVAIGLFIVGTCGCFGSDETLACFVAGCALNWDGSYHFEVEERHDSFNFTIENLLNIGTFMFLGAIMPWNQLHMPSQTGITVARLVGLGFLILIFRRMPAIMMGYRFMTKICDNWREALFMGYFAPIGVGAISYVEYARRLLPDPGESDTEINNLTAAMIPVVYWLVFFSIVIHGLSIPVLNCLYKWFKVPPVRDHPVEIILLSEKEPVPNNSVVDHCGYSVILNNRFSRSSKQHAHSGHGNPHRNGTDTMVLRRSGETSHRSSLERASTKGSSRELEQTISARNVV
ncbi:Cation/H+ exchanger [Penicillium coprophilum]|uniref:Cation/H+ exchanger n=1 Tax=Penicillium coprophilum TaxID=36646 RepID=UPI002382A24F|nr:Cation/H+ exchanger [Penicillium coprophilum]KAJ5159262.1 Cation/H+ exchanger [Penicillium coprophilum]